MVKGAPVRSVAPLLLAALACGCLGACGYFGSGTNSAAKPSAGAAHPSPAAAADTDPLRADLVAAVSNAKDPGPVDLKFALQQRPAVGQPVTLALRLTPNMDLDHIEVRFHADEGLELHQGEEFTPVDHAQTAVPVDHALVLVPQREGVYSVMATVTTGSAAGSISRSFAIPIIVGAAP